MIGRNGERGLGISALAARHDDDDIRKKSFRKRFINQTWSNAGIYIKKKTIQILPSYNYPIITNSFIRIIQNRKHIHQQWRVFVA